MSVSCGKCVKSGGGIPGAQFGPSGFGMPGGMGLPGMGMPGAVGLPGQGSDSMGAMFGMFQALMMNMMATLMNGIVGQLSQVGQGGALVPGQSPNFGGGGGGSPGTGNFLGGGGGNGGGGAAPASGSGSAGGPVGGASGNLVSRQGKQMDSSIAANFDAMVAAAKKDGVDLKITSANRSRAEQERLYQAYLNGTGNLAAKPGTSNHEKGQAIDFTNTPGAFNWLAKNAEKFGFKNLKGEPWHYSPTGR